MDEMKKRNVKASGAESKYSNDLIRTLSNDPTVHVTPGLTSHSIRSGETNFLSEHPKIKDDGLTHRGGWSLERMQTIFYYKSGNIRTDSCVGRVLSEWPLPDEGGFPPNYEVLPILERQLFKHYASVLILLCLTSILVMQYAHVKAKCERGERHVL